MNSIKDGAIFGCYKVLKSKKDEKRKNEYMCYVQCMNCNNIKWITSIGLRSAKRRSGNSCNLCYDRSNRRKDPFSVAVQHRLVGQMKRKNKELGVPYNLSLKFVKKLAKDNCYYCGSPPQNIYTVIRKLGDSLLLNYNGVDRIDSSKGYEESNVVTCCEKCNKMKLNYSQEEFYDQIIKINKHLKLTT